MFCSRTRFSDKWNGFFHDSFIRKSSAYRASRRSTTTTTPRTMILPINANGIPTLCVCTALPRQAVNLARLRYPYKGWGLSTAFRCLIEMAEMLQIEREFRHVLVFLCLINQGWVLFKFRNYYFATANKVRLTFAPLFFNLNFTAKTVKLGGVATKHTATA